jgi:hypothetical protein
MPLSALRNYALAGVFGLSLIVTTAACEREPARDMRGTGGEVVEPMEEPTTGVGDERVYEVPDELEDGQQVCSAGEIVYVADALRPSERDDETMHQVGHCTDPDLALYMPADRLRGEETLASDVVFVKAGQDRYLRLRPMEGQQEEGQQPQQRQPQRQQQRGQS